MQYGTIFNIQRFTIHDGPGMRTELFLKGCPLRCRWCSNPEGQEAHPEPGVYASRCVGLAGCGVCREVCPEEGALRFDEEGRLAQVDRRRCTNCMKCAEVCPADAIRSWGERMSIEDAMEVIRRDRSYYEESGGGVTVSGGEPLTETGFVRELFAACRSEGISTCLESTLHAPWEKVEELLPVTDLFIADLKMMDSGKHSLYTGIGNEQILSNLAALSERTSRLILRIPVIPGVNDDEENITATADFILREMNGRIENLQLLSFMFLGEEKYRSLGIAYPMKGLSFDREAFQKKVEEIADFFQAKGICCTIGNKRREQNS